MNIMPFMSAPQESLVGAASNYGYPITSGLLGALNGHDYTQDALALAGNPHAGPYATAPGFPPGSGSPIATGNSGGSGASVVGGLLGALAKNPSLVKDGVGAVSDLLGGGLGAYGSGAAADAATTAALGSVGAQTAGESAAIQAANDAALGGSGAASGAATAAPAASGASSGLLGSLGALALPAAIFASYETTNPVNESAAWWNDMTNRLGSSDPNTANMARLTVANDYLNGGGDMPYSQQQLASFGITPQYLADLSRPITSPAPGGKGWLGGGYTGASRA